ncbi:MAG TPA: OstA-like protein [Puia sp.]|jgi:lipopolysaccharide export system protein LptA|nr:OstA-like protein [Puia sp.]
MNRWLSACGNWVFVCIILFTAATRVEGQVAFGRPGSDTVKIVKILNDEIYHSEQIDSATTITTLVHHVEIQQETTLIFCDSLRMNPHEDYIECFGNVHINDNDSVNIYSDYMKYLVSKKFVHFEKNVRLTDGKGILTSDALDYDMNLHLGTYNHGGKIVNKESVLTSDRGVYFEDSKDVHFSGNVILRDPQYDLSADSLVYNTQSQLSTFITKTDVLFKDTTHRTVTTWSGNYDLQNKKAKFTRGLNHQPVITDGSQLITGNDVNVDDSTGISTADGNADYRDTAQGIRLVADHMINNRKKNTFLATKRPMMIIKQDKDSIYITADTFRSARLVDFEVEQKILAHQDSLHRIYIDSLEKRAADSLHVAALAKAYRDSIAARTDSLNMDRSDSLSPGAADSLARLGLDSLHRLGLDTLAGLRGDTTKRTVKKDSTQVDRLAAALADTTKHLNDKQRKKLEKELAKARIDSARAIVQAVKDSIARKVQAVKDSISDAKYALKVKQKADRDSVRAAAAAVKKRQRDAVDSVRRAGFTAKARAKAVADSILRRKDLDTTIAQALARGDTIRTRRLADSLKKKGGWTDSALTHNGLPIPVDSFALRRRDDSLRDVAVQQHYADSIAHLPPTDSTLRYIIGYHHVRIFSDSLQAVSDSLYYSTKDSIFRLYYDPVAWGNGNYQITGDTMYMYTKNKKANRLYVFENALAVNRVAKSLYNQLKGTTINCFFLDGEIDYIRAKGNSESIYYVADDNKAYTGANRAHGDIIDMIFAPKLDSAGNIAVDSAGKPKGKELDRVVLRNDAEGTMTPMRRVNPDDMILRGFKWLEKRRPKSKQAMFESLHNENEEESFEAAEQAAEQAPGSQRAALPTIPIIKPKQQPKRHP